MADSGGRTATFYVTGTEPCTSTLGWILLKIYVMKEEVKSWRKVCRFIFGENRKINGTFFMRNIL